LGDGTTVDRPGPVHVCGSGAGEGCAGGAPLTGVISLTGGGVGDPNTGSTASYTCALLQGGSVACWGANMRGALGDGTTTAHALPAPVCASGSGPICAGGAPLSGTVGIAAGGDFACALMANGTVKCWGNDAAGQLGDGTQGGPQHQRLNPVDVCITGSSSTCSLLTDVTAVAAGEASACAALSTGAVVCWGANGFGQLGMGSTAPQANPAPVCASRDAATCDANNREMNAAKRICAEVQIAAP
ncbi:MAG TPA: hypothetical protein VFH51_05805, partial [Myxococcota bacterium]|nr:hypothetical protein [Myxococcota bacterium]